MSRCIICGWTLAASADKGCVPGDCCYRPDDPHEQRRLSDRRELVNRATEAVKASWSSHGDVPFPLYDPEARAIAAAVMQAIGY